MTFWMGAGLILLIVLSRLLWVSLRTRQTASVPVNESYHAQREALAQSAADGDIEAVHLPGLEHELARATLADAARAGATPRPVSSTDRYALSLLVLVLLPAIAIPVYLKFGSPNLPGAETPSNPLTATEMVSQLQARIDRAPNDPEPRMWLARVYMTSGQYGEAVQVFEALNALVPEQPAVLLQYADALAMTHNGVITGKATALIHRALALEPDNVTGLWLAGVAADQSGNAREALNYLRRARQASAATELPTAELDALIAEVETRSGIKTAEEADSVAGKANLTPRIAVDVKVDQTLIADLPPETAVYVLAKAIGGPPMPVAVKRLTLGELPLIVALDDSLAMAPQFKLSTAEKIMVTARISRGGGPIAQSGDIEGTAGPLRVGIDTSVKITIDAVIP